ncbi:MAG: lysophospholipase [Acidimicrobiia bacterium]|nr:lysophospholipase [Acidimicrobiia bacterium]MYF84554.1 lysophospholipase [Acidimicrobiia bacterium]
MTAPPATSMEIVTTRGGVTELRRRWEAEDPWASLLIVHGLAEHSGRYRNVGARLAAAGIDTHAFDLMGFGASGGTRADIADWHTYLFQLSDNLARLLDRGLPRVVLGHSVGGLLTIDYAMSRHRQPDLVVLNAPAVDAVVPAWKRRASPILAGLVPTLTLANPINPDEIFNDPTAVAGYLADPLLEPRTTVRLGAHLLGTMDRVAASLDRFTPPCLLTHGEDDTLVPPATSDALARLPNVERRLYPGVRHASLQEPVGAMIIDDIVAWIRTMTDH